MKLTLLKIFFVTAIFCETHYARADVKTRGYIIENNGIKVEVTAAEMNDASDIETSIEGLAQEIRQEHEQSPGAFLEVAWINSDEESRHPAYDQKPVSSTQSFINRFINRVTDFNIFPDRKAGIDDHKKLHRGRAHQFYLKHHNLTWVAVRVVNSYGFRVGSFVFTTMSLVQGLEVSLPVALACTLTGVLYTPINQFAEKFRFYNYFKAESFPRLKKLLENPNSAKRLDKGHGLFNWGLCETLFGGVIVGGENMVRNILNLPLKIPSLLEFGFTTGLAANTQGRWDRAAKKHLKLEEHDPNISPLQRQANYKKRGALGSVMSVVGFTFANSDHPAVKTIGYVILGTLGILGHRYDKRMDARLEACKSELHISK